MALFAFRCSCPVTPEPRCVVLSHMAIQPSLFAPKSVRWIFESHPILTPCHFNQANFFLPCVRVHSGAVLLKPYYASIFFSCKRQNFSLVFGSRLAQVGTGKRKIVFAAKATTVGQQIFHKDMDAPSPFCFPLIPDLGTVEGPALYINRRAIDSWKLETRR